MRVKETADDYRMYPDPDLAPFDLTDDFIDRCRDRVPELPDAKCDRYTKDYGLKKKDAAQIAGDPVVARLFEDARALAPEAVATVANVIVNLVPACKLIVAAQVASLSKLLAADAITFAQAREVLEAIDGTEFDPVKIVDERHMRQSTDTDALAQTVEEVLARCEDQVRQYREGNRKVVGFLVGQCMKASKGSGNPKIFNKLLIEFLERG
jgi:aspartyl-tRNA(Asn)/glutamyl-tRNA(Gln) amidotransferase subunit B